MQQSTHTPFSARLAAFLLAVLCTFALPAIPAHAASPSSVCWMWPLSSSFGYSCIISTFGYRSSTSSSHEGLDIQASGGAAVYASRAGTVITSKSSSSYGNVVVIDHGDGYTTLYAHLSKRLVKVGESVEQGELIGKVGKTGHAFGNHLHFEIERNGTLVNPTPVSVDPSSISENSAKTKKAQQIEYFFRGTLEETSPSRCGILVPDLENNTVMLSWTAALHADAYHVVCQAPDGVSYTLETTERTATLLLPFSGAYSFSVTAVNSETGETTSSRNTRSVSCQSDFSALVPALASVSAAPLPSPAVSPSPAASSSPASSVDGTLLIGVAARISGKVTIAVEGESQPDASLLLVFRNTQQKITGLESVSVKEVFSDSLEFSVPKTTRSVCAYLLGDDSAPLSNCVTISWTF